MKRIYKSKKWILIVCALCAAVAALCFLPIMETHVSGIENYSPADSTLSLSLYLYPNEDFPEQFDYVAGDYQYYFNGKLSGGYATAFSFLTYSPEQYAAAKEYCLQEFSLTDEHQYRVGNYTFVEHLCYTSKNETGNYVVSCQYPAIFNMFAFSDEDNTLLFLGYFNADSDAPSSQLALSDFAAFFQEHFGQYYTLEY